MLALSHRKDLLLLSSSRAKTANYLQRLGRICLWSRFMGEQQITRGSDKAERGVDGRQGEFWFSVRQIDRDWFILLEEITRKRSLHSQQMYSGK